MDTKEQRAREVRKEIADNILQQLGGRQFLLMTGAKSLLILESGLRFKLPIGAWGCVEIILTPMDTYTVKFQLPREGDRSRISEHEQIYCEDLAKLISEQTGLELRLPRIFRGKRS